MSKTQFRPAMNFIKKEVYEYFTVSIIRSVGFQRPSTKATMRRFQFSAVIPVILPLLLSLPCHAMKGINPDGSLDKTTLSKAYFEGEFWSVITALEEYRKNGLATATRDDSVYTYKYLSVVYAADPSTRQKAESFMYLLLRMMPTIDLLDLYISDNIESIFQKVRSDFARMQKLSETNKVGTRTGKQDTSSGAAYNESSADSSRVAMGATSPELVHPTSPPSPPIKPTVLAQDTEGKPLWKRKRPWILGASGLAVASVVAAYVYFNDNARTETIPVPSADN